MRVLMLAHNVYEQGSAVRAVSLARWLVRSGHEVTLIAARRHAGLKAVAENFDGVRVFELGDVAPHRIRNAGLSPMDILARIAHVLRERYDIVHSFEPRPSSTMPALLARRRGAAFVADWADLWGPDGMAAYWPPLLRVTLGAIDGPWQAYTRRKADAVTVISTDLERRALALGIPAARIRVVPVGANHDLFAFAPQPDADARRRLGIPEDALVLVHTGFNPFDVWLLAYLFEEIARREPRAFLLMSGGRFDIVQERARAAGAAHRVLHVGVLRYGELGTAIACGDVMLVPYTQKPHNAARFPNRVGDYFAVGRPVATNPTGDLARLITEHRIGIVAPESPREFADAVLDLLAQPELCREMGRRARALAETKLSWRAIADGVNELYLELAGGKPPRSSSIS